MTTTIVRRQRSLIPALRLPSGDRLLRSAVHRRLATIEDGCIELREGDQLVRFGARG